MRELDEAIKILRTIVDEDIPTLNKALGGK